MRDGRRELDPYGGPLPKLAIDEQAAAVVVEDLPGDGQPQTCTVGLGCEEGAEELVEVFGRDAFSGIPNFDFRPPAGDVG